MKLYESMGRDYSIHPNILFRFNIGGIKAIQILDARLGVFLDVEVEKEVNSLIPSWKYMLIYFYMFPAIEYFVEDATDEII